MTGVSKEDLGSVAFSAAAAGPVASDLRTPCGSPGGFCGSVGFGEELQLLFNSCLGFDSLCALGLN